MKSESNNTYYWDSPEPWTSELLMKDWRRYVDRAASEHKPALTTLESFGQDAGFLLEAFQYAREHGVDVMVAAQSDGTFH